MSFFTNVRGTDFIVGTTDAKRIIIFSGLTGLSAILEPQHPAIDEVYSKLYKKNTLHSIFISSEHKQQLHTHV